ncbi:uncharacterized protein LOC130689907 [Daphnia carinata]|uniref:uncharacterized protein LOC130689907 n=1 Tax=Daphnia carinata TaxID=120202 RepID=UPI00257C89B8|nr:uncharacterized protein LOC130689907 [Daphnia carinata]
MFFRKFVVAVFLLTVAYTVSGASVATDGSNSEEATENNSKEAFEDGSELGKASKSLNETSIIKLRDVSIQLKKLKTKVSENEPTVNKAHNSTSGTSDVKLGDEKVGPCARTTCFTKNGTTTCTLSPACTTTKAATSFKLSKQTTAKATTAKTPVLDISSDTLPKKI